MPCRHGETGIRNRLKIGLFGLRVRFPLAAPNDVVKYCWIARTKQSVITLAALITPSSRLERKKYDVERYQASNRTARYGNSVDALPSDYRRRSFGCGRTGLFSAVFLVVEGIVGVDSWAMEAVFMAVAFTFVVGFALLWCAESFTLKMRERFRPFAYATVGLIGYGVWSLLVFSATINSVLAMVGESVLTNGQIGAIALNGAALGFVAFLFAKLLDVKLGNRKTTAIIMLVVEVTAAIIGLIIMILMFRALYAA